MDDLLILGGGVIGLSLAYEMAGRGARVRVLDRAAPGREASWAGAGILPPANRRAARHPLEELAGLSHELHPRWAAELRELTGVDTGYRQTGGLHVARDEQSASELQAAAADLRSRGVAVEDVAPETLAELEPALAGGAAPTAACLLPEEAQIRNPRHLKALLAACTARGVEIEAGVAAEQLVARGGRVLGIETCRGRRTAGQCCICSGAWSRALLATLGVNLQLRPVRGQMVLLSTPAARLRHIVNEGSRYLVPRPDGRLLVGSTEEDAGFDKRNTGQAVAELLQFALGLAPGLRGACFERCWAGLRPGTADGLPYLGRVPGMENLLVAAGHFRSGLQMSPGTAVVMAQLLRDEAPQIDLSPFAVDRG